MAERESVPWRAPPAVVALASSMRPAVPPRTPEALAQEARVARAPEVATDHLLVGVGARLSLPHGAAPPAMVDDATARGAREETFSGPAHSLVEVIRPANGSAYACLPTADGTEVQLDCLGVNSSAVLITTLEQMERALARLLAHRDGGDLFIDGEFDAVADSQGTMRMRMAVLSLYAPRVGRAILLHLASLFAPWETDDGDYQVPAGTRGLAALVSVMRTDRLRRAWWGGDSTDARALVYSLPCLAPLGPVRDLQLEVRARVQAGTLPAGTPLSLAAICARGLNAHLDKTQQRAAWRELPSARMIAYAAGDALVLERLARALESGELARALRAVAPLLSASFAAAGAERREAGDFVTGLQECVRALNGSQVEYTLVSAGGRPHAPEFTFEVCAHGLGSGIRGCGPSKSAAKQAAARAACLAWIPRDGDDGAIAPGDAGPSAALSPPYAPAPVAARAARPADTRASSAGGDDDDGAPWPASGPGAAKCRASDFVSGLHEWAQGTPGSRVQFEPVKASGPPHRPHFDAHVVVAYTDRAGATQQLRFAGESDASSQAAKHAAARAACQAVMASASRKRRGRDGDDSDE